ncbi:MAG: hypothetical protein OXR73_08535, partial [Myxococcales bacterium]|nr:hypothetical protein [Myxococcales bacterium]
MRRAWPSCAHLEEAAGELLKRVAGGHGADATELDALARAVLEAPLVTAAQAVLDAEGNWKIRDPARVGADRCRRQDISRDGAWTHRMPASLP